jgi:hypothetical protein
VSGYLYVLVDLPLKKEPWCSLNKKLDGPQMQGYFCDQTRQIAFPEVLSQKDATWKGVPEPYFPVINITNRRLLPNFLVTLCILVPSFFLLEKQHCSEPF